MAPTLASAGLSAASMLVWPSPCLTALLAVCMRLFATYLPVADARHVAGMRVKPDKLDKFMNGDPMGQLHTPPPVLLTFNRERAL
jgi:hypothetical protein